MHLNHISVKAICIVINGRKELLVSEDYDTTKEKMFCVPLGGHVRFNEYSIDTIKREFKEEINALLCDVKFITVLENMFTWNGTNYHEINFVYKAGLSDKSLYDNNSIPFLDSKYPGVKVKWINVDDFKSGKHILYPEELSNQLEKIMG